VRLNPPSFDWDKNMASAEETGEKRNPGPPAIEEFDTLIHGSPLSYPAAFAHHVPHDPPAYSQEINVTVTSDGRPRHRRRHR
jgi:hypothetical protein